MRLFQPALPTELHSSRYITLNDDTRKICITMLDYMTKKTLDGCQTCFWCRHEFSTFPIGCPVHYIPSAIIKTCQSEITKEIYSIKQDIPSHLFHNTIDNTSQSMIPQMKPHENNYYETDGAFCSFNCAMAYVNENSTNPLYTQSKSLLMKIYNEIFSPNEPTYINPAPSWRLLANYGGFLNIQEFRSASADFVYIDRGYNVSAIPKVAPIGRVFEEMYIF